MQSPWIREASKACCSSSGCCPNPFLGFPHYVEASSSSSKPQSAAASRYQFEVSTTSSLYPHFHFTNHESLPSYHESFACFNKVYPHYSQTDEADKIRASEYPHLDSSVACFDYIGHGLFSYSQLQGSPFFDICCKSINLNSQLLYGEETEFQSGIKKRIMSFMNVSETDYTMVFTANQASAFKLLVESYPFGSNQNLLTVYDYQSEAIDVMIERAKKRGANCMSACFSWPNLKIQTEKLRKKIIKKRGLFVIPLQSKVTGSRYSYTWLSLAQENGWHVLLDATALGAKEMETLGLSLFDPDFLICSFFKVFGENPSGFCCLFIKKSIGSSVLKGSTTNVGIVSLVPPLKLEAPKGKAPLHEIEEIIDSRTSNTLQCKALDHADSLGLVLISSRTRSLINWLVNALMSLQHPHSETGIPAVKIYGPKVMFDRGPAVAFNVFDWKGERIDPALVQKLADRNNISLSIGCLQHIWFSDKHEEMKEKDKFQPGIDVVTAAIGYLTNFEDIYRLWVFVSRFLDADFLDKEKWRYKALNQRTIEI
ncbi:molybdenum cofactor sulfurase isoform X1 [Gossypium raimondii]|uniref:molybdenum cofactor sulfurase isoform X1 n=1 Tax=Gossypium raimondii TaxID=29730 RepID=UPI00063ABB05|nr:molybdenum cofactor sulfurase isoform X1 [Gossypium raimondii]